jgi:hypothetical protein
VLVKQRLSDDIKAMRQLVRRRGRHSGKMLPLFAQDVLLQVTSKAFCTTYTVLVSQLAPAVSNLIIICISSRGLPR